MAKILVTGSKGQLGNELRIVSAGDTKNVYLFTDVVELDITDKGAVDNFFSANEPDIVVNCAAYTAVDKAESDRELCTAINVDAVKNLAEATRRGGGKMIHISTDYVYGGNGKAPYTENAPTAPQSVYGETKLAGEKALLAINNASIIIRTAWLYSPFGKNFVKTMIALGKEREMISVVNDQRGTPTYAADLAIAIAKIINSGKFISGIYNFSDAGECTWYEFAKEIHKVYGITGCEVVPVTTDMYPSAAKRPAYSVLNKRKIRISYGICIPDWKDSLKDCISRIKENNI